MTEKSVQCAGQGMSAEGVAAMIRERIYRRRHDRSGKTSHLRVHSSFTTDARIFISQAELNADAGASVTPMDEFNGIIRKLARFIGKLVVYLVSFITDKQRKCNMGIIQSLRKIADGMDGLNKENVATSQEVTILREEIDQLQENLSLMSKAAVEESNSAAAKLYAIQLAVQEQERRLALLLEEGRKKLSGS